MMKTYILTISEKFPSAHNRAGDKTLFEEKIKQKSKIHTIRENYDFWKKRIDEIQAGRACLSIRKWSGRPYRSKQIEIFNFTDVGIEKLEWDVLGWFVDSYDNDLTTKDLAKNDGLSYNDFKSWFKKYPEKSMAIIHFTDFRYNKL